MSDQKSKLIFWLIDLYVAGKKINSGTLYIMLVFVGFDFL